MWTDTVQLDSREHIRVHLYVYLFNLFFIYLIYLFIVCICVCRCVQTYIRIFFSKFLLFWPITKKFSWLVYTVSAVGVSQSWLLNEAVGGPRVEPPRRVDHSL